MLCHTYIYNAYHIYCYAKNVMQAAGTKLITCPSDFRFWVVDKNNLEPSG